MILSAIHYLARQILEKWCLRGQNLRSNKTYLKIKMGFCKFRFWLGQLVFSAGNIIQPALRSTWQIRHLEWIMRHALQVPLHDMYKTQNHKWELHLTFPEGHKLDLDHAMVSAGTIVQLCIAPCSVPNWVNDVSSMYSTSNGVKGVYCKYHGTTWTTLHQRKHSNSSPMDPNTEIQCEKMD